MMIELMEKGVFKMSCVPLSYHLKTGNEFCQGFLGLKQLMRTYVGEEGGEDT